LSKVVVSGNLWILISRRWLWVTCDRAPGTRAKAARPHRLTKTSQRESIEKAISSLQLRVNARFLIRPRDKNPRMKMGDCETGHRVNKRK
jgi:hypothetical protein